LPDLPQVHNPRKTKKRTQVRQAKERQAKRFYATSHPVWRRLRADQLNREPLCRECAKNGRVTAATVVDHINGDTSDNRPESLQPLCRGCHDRKTGIETGFGSAYREKKLVGQRKDT